MSGMQVARETIASHVPAERTRHFDVALHDAVTSSIESMVELHDAVCDCVQALREAEIGPVQMILAMKACAHDSATRYQPKPDEFTGSNVDLLIDHIVRWSIVEYYRTLK